MTEPKFLRTKTSPKAKRVSANKKVLKAAIKQVETPQPTQTPLDALGRLQDEWTQAEASYLTGLPASSKTSALILRHMEAPAPVDAPEYETSPYADDAPHSANQDAVIGRHRVDIANTRAIVMRLVRELDFATDNQPLFDTLAEVFANPNDKGVDKMREAYAALISLPGRVDMAKKLADTLKSLVPLERQAAGLADGYVDAATERAKREEAAVPTVVMTSFDAISKKFSQVMLKVKNG